MHCFRFHLAYLIFEEIAELSIDAFHSHIRKRYFWIRWIISNISLYHFLIDGAGFS